MNKRLRNRALQVRRLGVEENLWEDNYHRLLRLSWPRFFGLVIITYILMNSFFAFMFAASPGSVTNIQPGDWFSYFAFSVQTMSTIGYGVFSPATHYAHVLVTLEAAIGMFFTALLTGLMFSKFSRASARVVFSENILLTKFNGMPALQLRMGNIRANRVFEGRAKLALLRDEVSSEGERMRRIYDLKLLRNETPIFSLSWTLFHLIDAESPLHGVSLEQMVERNWEFTVAFIGLDQDMSQNIVANNLYTSNHIVRARKFADMVDLQDGVRIIDFSKLHEIEQ